MSILRRLIKLTWLLLPLFMFDFGCSYPTRGHLPGIEVPPPKLIHFMRRFGYLESNPSDSEALYHEVAIIEAIKNIQKYGALNQTGELDNPTLQLLSSPRCGVPDIEFRTLTRSRSKRYIIGARSWQKRKIKYYLYNSANWSAKMQREHIERDLEKAFNMWSRYNRLKFQRVYETSADIIVGFGSHYHGDNYPFDGPGNILAHAFYPYEMGSYGGDVHFDEDENWVENSTNLVDGVDFYSVALHELGHSLGLAHSPVYSSIMFPYYKGPGQSVLDYDDVLAMYELYVQRELFGDDKFDKYSPRSTSTTSQFEDTTASTSEAPTTKVDIQFTYEGDYETVSNHKRKYSTNMIWKNIDATTKLPKRNPPVGPGSYICQGHFDAVSMIKGAIYVFKGKFVWKLTTRYTIENDYPKSIHEMLPFLPGNIQSIDAVYERFDGASLYFTGKNYWIYDGEQLIENSPKNLTDFISTATNITKIDAAMVWPKNNLTYIFAGTQFWKINERIHGFEDSFPRPMHRWVGIPNHIDATATLANGKTYFFKDNLYWLYNNKFIRPERGYPRRASTAWLGCSPTIQRTKLRNSNTTILFI